MENDQHTPALAHGAPPIVRGDLAQYRRLARTADVETLRVLALVMAADLEEALAAARPRDG